MIATWKSNCRFAGSSILLITLAACGGASDSVGKCYSTISGLCSELGVVQSSPQPETSAVGLYKGAASNGRAIAGLVLDDNSFYFIYSDVNNPSIAAGFVNGTLQANAGNYSSTDAIDTNLEGQGIQIATVTGTYGPKQFMNGSIQYPTSNQTVSFTANYNSDYELTPTADVITGNYAGSAAISTGIENISFSIDGNGNLSGSGSSGCKFSGTVKPRSSGNAYVATIQLGAAPCAWPGSTLTGISYFDRTTKTDYVMTSLPGQSSGLLAVATKQ